MTNAAMTADDLLLLTSRDQRTLWCLLAPAALRFQTAVDSQGINRRNPRDSIVAIIDEGRKVCAECAADICSYYARIAPDLFDRDPLRAAAFRDEFAGVLRHHLSAEYASNTINNRYKKNNPAIFLAMGDIGWEMSAILSAYIGVNIEVANKPNGLFIAKQRIIDHDLGEKSDIPIVPTIYGDDPFMLMRSCLEHIEAKGRLLSILGEDVIKSADKAGITASMSQDEIFTIDFYHRDTPQIRAPMLLNGPGRGMFHFENEFADVRKKLKKMRAEAAADVVAETQPTP